MGMIWATIGAISMLAMAAPARAQQSADKEAEADSTTEHDGFRVAETSSGFQLVEHGHWQNSPLGSTVINPIAVKLGQPAQRLRILSANRPAGFRRALYLPHVYAAEAKFALPPGLLDALLWTESRYNPLAISKAGAAGLGQLMPGTARDLGVLNRFDPKENVLGAARYLRQMLDKFGVVHLAVAAYNAGPGAVKRAGGIPINGETPGYVRDVLNRWRL